MATLYEKSLVTLKQKQVQTKRTLFKHNLFGLAFLTFFAYVTGYLLYDGLRTWSVFQIAIGGTLFFFILFSFWTVSREIQMLGGRGRFHYARGSIRALQEYYNQEVLPAYLSQYFSRVEVLPIEQSLASGVDAIQQFFDGWLGRGNLPAVDTKLWVDDVQILEYGIYRIRGGNRSGYEYEFNFLTLSSRQNVTNTEILIGGGRVPTPERKGFEKYQENDVWILHGSLSKEKLVTLGSRFKQLENYRKSFLHVDPDKIVLGLDYPEGFAEFNYTLRSIEPDLAYSLEQTKMALAAYKKLLVDLETILKKQVCS